MADEEKPKAAPQTIEDEAGLPENWGVVNSQPVIPGRQNGGPVGAPPMGMTGIDNFQSGQLPPFLGLSPDLVNAGTPGPRVPVTRLMPIAPGGVSQIVAATKSVVQPIIDKAIAGIVIPPQTNASDGLDHGRTPWEGDPSVVQLSEEFYPFLSSSPTSSGPKTQIGQLGWALAGTVGGTPGFLGGQYPNVGQYYWSNNNVTTDAGWLLLNISNETSDYVNTGLALFDNPGWIMSFVFKLDATYDSVLNFDMTQKSIYIGLVGTTSSTSFIGASSRPNVFCGLRYDTSTTSPSINDSFFTFEVVANPGGSSPGRNNTQGVTQVTTTAPTVGVWHRLDISCSQAGQVSMVLDGTQTFGTAIPTMTVNGTVDAIWANGTARLNWTVASTPPLQVNPWAAGTSLTVAGYTPPNAEFNGTFILSSGADNEVWYSEPDTTTLVTGSGITLTGFPAFIPAFIFGNDDTSSPTATGATFVVDFWSYTANAGLANGGTPDATKSRYF